MTRQKANSEILNRLYQYITDNPDIRLGQALVNLDVLVMLPGLQTYRDPFYEEPDIMLARVDEAIEKQSKGG